MGRLSALSASMAPPLTTPLTTLLGVQHPIMLAGMDQVAGPELAAAVCNAGGFGTLGGARYTPKMLREMIEELKEGLVDKKAPFGVDLLLPQVGGSARKTNVSTIVTLKRERARRCRGGGKGMMEESRVGDVG